MAKMAAEKVEGDITIETVTAFLVNLGLDAKAPDPSDDAKDTPPDGESNPLAEVADLGQRLADAASGKVGSDVEKRINAAESPAEVASIMAEQGLLKSQ